MERVSIQFLGKPNAQSVVIGPGQDHRIGPRPGFELRFPIQGGFLLRRIYYKGDGALFDRAAQASWCRKECVLRLQPKNHLG